MAVQTQSGSAESGAGGALELRCCDVSRECSLVSFIGCCRESLTAIVLKTGGSCEGR